MTDFQRTLESVVAEKQVTGASFAYWDGTVLYTATAGFRNSVTADPVTTDTVMHIGSITKVMNTVLVMQLVDEGRISLDEPVAHVLPELRLRDSQALPAITCGMLLNHTSGIDGEWLPEYGPDQERIVDTIERCATLDQLFAPGEAASYCNIGTVIAGYLVQRLRSMSWYRLMKRRIFEPLGLNHALADIMEVPRFRCSIGDLTNPVNGNAIQTTRPFLAPSFAPAGSTVMMSATDLVTFARALLNGGVGVNGMRILSEASALKMTKPTAEFFCPKDKVGLGWLIKPSGILTHRGGGPGVDSFLFADPRRGRVVALLTNIDRGQALQEEFLDPILDSWGSAKETDTRAATERIEVTPYVGVYENNTRRIEVFAQHEALFMRIGEKFSVYDTSVPTDSMLSRPLLKLSMLAPDEFEVQSEIVGTPNVEAKFVRPGAEGPVRFLAMQHRLMRRSSG